MEKKMRGKSFLRTRAQKKDGCARPREKLSRSPGGSSPKEQQEGGQAIGTNPGPGAGNREVVCKFPSGIIRPKRFCRPTGDIPRLTQR